MKLIRHSTIRSSVGLLCIAWLCATAAGCADPGVEADSAGTASTQEPATAEDVRAGTETVAGSTAVPNAHVPNTIVANTSVPNTAVESADVESAEVESAEVESAEVESAEVESTDVESTDVEGVSHRPRGERFAKAWRIFYDVEFHEPDIDDALIQAGAPMVPAICEAIRHRDMKRRRYAIGALGFIGNRAALPTLQDVLQARDEQGYVRSDALHAIYLIDRALGMRLAREHRDEGPHIVSTAEAILQQAPWLLEPTEE